MVQFYFLSIVLNVLGGLILASDRLGTKLPAIEMVREYLDEKPSLKLGFALLAIITGILKLLSAMKGDVPVAGDLLPVLAGWSVGVILFSEYYSVRNEPESVTVERPKNFLIRNKTVFGIAAAVIGVIHFFIPRVLFL